MEILEFFSACANGNSETVKQLIQNHSQIESIFDPVTPLYLACAEGHLEVVEILLNDKRIDVNQGCVEKQTPFFIACKNGHIEIVKLLLKDQRVDLNKVDEYDQTPFYSACEEEHIEIVKLLLNDERVDNNKRVDRNKISAYGESAFFSACYKEHIEIIKLLLHDPKVDVNKVNRVGKTPFYSACCRGDLDTVKILLNNKRVDINQGKSENPIHIACLFPEIVQYMLASGREVDIQAKDSRGNTPIERAIEHEKEDKMLWESEEEFQERKIQTPKIIELFKSYERNPIETRLNLRIQLGLAHHDASSLYAIVVLLSDHYLDFKNKKYECK